MPSGTVLTGFSADVDWRPLQFVQAMTGVRFCDLCGVLPRNLHLLECTHGFCHHCFNQLLVKPCKCPFDKRRFTAREVQTFEFTESELLQFEVHCWNYADGCDFVGDYLSMTSHFLNDCSRHSVGCPRCKYRVRRSEILEHNSTECKRSCAEQGMNKSHAKDFVADDIVRVSQDMQRRVISFCNDQETLQNKANALSSSIKCLGKKLLQVKKVAENAVNACNVQKQDALRAVQVSVSGDERKVTNKILSHVGVSNPAATKGEEEEETAGGVTGPRGLDRPRRSTRRRKGRRSNRQR
ncbi:uncharacterized protein LOC135392558 [Ornithodoros turicata]|uniref:uncharacterized protein LOC135392558 n=1 Tax=Ornithodoros turicata TaxID=34597 RepID=UPI003138896E